MVKKLLLLCTYLNTPSYNEKRKLSSKKAPETPDQHEWMRDGGVLLNFRQNVAPLWWWVRVSCHASSLPLYTSVAARQANFTLGCGLWVSSRSPATSILNACVRACVLLHFYYYNMNNSSVDTFSWCLYCFIEWWPIIWKWFWLVDDTGPEVIININNIGEKDIYDASQIEQ